MKHTKLYILILMIGFIFPSFSFSGGSDVTGCGNYDETKIMREVKTLAIRLLRQASQKNIMSHIRNERTRELILTHAQKLADDLERSIVIPKAETRHKEDETQDQSQERIQRERQEFIIDGEEKTFKTIHQPSASIYVNIAYALEQNITLEGAIADFVREGSRHLFIDDHYKLAEFEEMAFDLLSALGECNGYLSLIHVMESYSETREVETKEELKKSIFERKTLYERATQSPGAYGETQSHRYQFYGVGATLVQGSKDVHAGADLHWGIFSYDDGRFEAYGLKTRFLVDTQATILLKRIGVFKLKAPQRWNPAERFFLGTNFQVFDYEADAIRDFTTNDFLSFGFSAQYYPTDRWRIYADTHASGLKDVQYHFLDSTKVDSQDINVYGVEVGTCIANADSTVLCEIGSRYESNELRHMEDLGRLENFARLRYNLSNPERGMVRRKTESGASYYDPADEPATIWLNVEFNQDQWNMSNKTTDVIPSQQTWTLGLLFEY